MKSPGRRGYKAIIERRPVTPPPRVALAAEAKAKLAKGEPLTQEEHRLMIFALPRKERRRLKIKTTDVRETLDALTMLAVPGEMTTADKNKAKAYRRKARAAA